MAKRQRPCTVPLQPLARRLGFGSRAQHSRSPLPCPPSRPPNRTPTPLVSSLRLVCPQAEKVDPLQPDADPTALLEQYTALLGAEKDCLQVTH